jgi:hypothetical protein
VPGPDPTFTTTVTRPEDLLLVTFEFVNMAPRQDGSAVLERVQPDSPAFVVAVLPPQHVTDTVPGEVELNVVLANRTRLAFRLADEVQSLPLTLADLLAWARHTPSVTGNAVASVPPDGLRPFIFEPSRTQTAIELPYRLVLSPDDTAAWAHSVVPVTRKGVTEVWHTRLGVRAGEAGEDVDESALPTVRAVWSRDIEPGGGQPSPGPGMAGTHPDRAQRIAIVNLSSGFANEVLRLPQEPLPYDPPPLQVHHLVLSALGGWTDIVGNWDFPEDNGLVFPNQSIDGSPPQFAVTGWHQVIGQGRDQYVRIVERGVLYPLGHRAQRTRVFERRLGPDGTTEELQRIEDTVLVREPVRDYDAVRTDHLRDASLPLRRVRIDTRTVAALQAPVDQHAFVVRGADGRPYPFQVRGQDWAGGQVDLNMPLVFVPDGSGDDPAQAYEDPEVNQVATSGQNVTLSEAAHRASTLPVLSFTFAAVPTGSGFLPFVEQATVRLPALDHLVGSAAPALPAVVTLVDPATTTGVFAQLIEPFNVTVPPTRAGGLAAPPLAVGAVSTTRGVLPADVDDLDGLKARLFSGLNTRLLGGIDLASAVDRIAGLDQLPTLVHTDVDGHGRVTFSWSPKLVRRAGPVDLEHASLTLTTTIDVGGAGAQGAPSSVVQGAMRSFAIDFAGVVTVRFEALEFTSRVGQRVDVRASGVTVELQRELAFLDALTQGLPTNGFSDGPSVGVTPQGVTAGYSISVPTIGIGILTIEHLVVSAGVLLPFDDRPAAVRLAFSERANPFLTTVSMLGGGGYLAIEVDTAGVRRIEGALEVGADTTVDFAVISASVHVLAGFYFGLRTVDGRDAIEFSGYLRIGGAVELLGIAGVSIELTLSMALDITPGQPARIGGRASVVVSVHLLMFTKALTLSAEKWFDIPSADPAFDELVTLEDWETYWRAFA